MNVNNESDTDAKLRTIKLLLEVMMYVLGVILYTVYITKGLLAIGIL